MGIGGGIKNRRVKVKDIRGVCDLPVLSPSNRKLIDWVAGYTLSAPGAVLKMAMSIDDVFQGIGETDGYVAADTAEKFV